MPLNCRVGLVGHCVASPIGEMNITIARNADIYRWLIKPHPTLKMIEPPEEVDYIVCPIGEKYEQFVREVDIVLFVKSHIDLNFVIVIGRLGKRLCRIPRNFQLPTSLEGWNQFDQLVREPYQYELT